MKKRRCHLKEVVNEISITLNIKPTEAASLLRLMFKDQDVVRYAKLFLEAKQALKRKKNISDTELCRSFFDPILMHDPLLKLVTKKEEIN